MFVCKKCGYHQPLSAQSRINQLVDDDSFVEINENLIATMPFFFPDYKMKLETAAKRCQLKEAVITGMARVSGNEIYLGVMDSRFIMGSMGITVGEKIAQLFDIARERKKPVILVTASGGARMQEGLYSLFQMAKTSIAIAQYKNEGGFYISILSHPTTGGVSASIAFLGDIIISEPKAMIGFAGRRVIEQTTRETLPENFQTAEFWLEQGYLDILVDRRQLKNVLLKLIKFHNSL